MNSGIYMIINIINEKVYIGSSINIKRRWKDHKYMLRYNKHDNIYLQRAWNKYGENNFKFEILTLCDKKDIILNEQYYLNKYNKSKLYNILEKAYSNIGFTHTEESKNKISKANKGRVVTEETKKKMSNSHKGKKLSYKQIKQMSKRLKGKTYEEIYGIEKAKEIKKKLLKYNRGENNSTSKLTNKNVIKIKKLLLKEDKTHIQIAKQFNVSEQAITGISCNRNWKHIKIDGWDEYLKRDKKYKPPTFYGIEHPNSKLTTENIINIKKLLIQSLSFRKIAKLFNVRHGTISRVYREISYKDITFYEWEEFINNKKDKNA